MGHLYEINISDTIDDIFDENGCISIPNNFTTDTKRKRIKNSTFSYKDSNEYRILIQNFSSGVRLKELCSVAIVLCKIVSGIKEPNRDEKRNLSLLIEWYHNNWSLVYPMLPFINLRDENNEIINGEREINEMRPRKKRLNGNI